MWSNTLNASTPKVKDIFIHPSSPSFIIIHKLDTQPCSFQESSKMETCSLTYPGNTDVTFLLLFHPSKISWNKVATNVTRMQGQTGPLYRKSAFG